MRDCLIKFSKEECHLVDFVENGRIYVNTAEYFTSCESEVVGQNDKFEMVSSYHQHDGASIELDGRKFKIAKPFGIREGEADYSHIFCLYALSDESISRSSEGKAFDERLWDEFGSYFVFIHDANSFMKKLSSKLKELNIRYKADYIKYFFPDTHEGMLVHLKKEIYFLIKRNTE